jgi:RNA-directed DNA polymerase
MKKNPKWILDADISKCFDRIDHGKLLEKLKTFSLMEKQIRAWLKAQIMEGYANDPRAKVETPQLILKRGTCHLTSPGKHSATLN